jgi:hypothetical protein
MSEKGQKGEPGQKGDQGQKGQTGDQGQKGQTGDQGQKGQMGDQGQKGQKGDQGQKGQTGDQGPKGSQGNDGQKGSKGDIGTSLLTGSGIPINSLGNDGDVYINLVNDDLYSKISGSWVLQGNIKGDKGEPGTGVNGFSAYMASGSQISSSGTLANWTIEPIPYYDTDNFIGTSYFDETTGEYTVPITGYYHIKLVFNYDLATAPTSNLGSGIPHITIMRDGNEISKAPLPIIDVNIPLTLTMRSILKTGTAIISVDYRLGAGDVISTYFDTDGETLPALNIGADKFVTLFSIHQFA